MLMIYKIFELHHRYNQFDLLPVQCAWVKILQNYINFLKPGGLPFYNQPYYRLFENVMAPDSRLYKGYSFPKDASLNSPGFHRLWLGYIDEIRGLNCWICKVELAVKFRSTFHHRMKPPFVATWYIHLNVEVSHSK